MAQDVLITRSCPRIELDAWASSLPQGARTMEVHNVQGLKQRSARHSRAPCRAAADGFAVSAAVERLSNQEERLDEPVDRGICPNNRTQGSGDDRVRADSLGSGRGGVPHLQH